MHYGPLEYSAVLPLNHMKISLHLLVWEMTLRRLSRYRPTVCLHLQSGHCGFPQFCHELRRDLLTGTGWRIDIAPVVECLELRNMLGSVINCPTSPSVSGEQPNTRDISAFPNMPTIRYPLNSKRLANRKHHCQNLFPFHDV